MFCWFSRKQQSVALFSTEAKFMNISFFVEDCIYLLSLAKSSALDLIGLVLLHNDNHSGTSFLKTQSQAIETNKLTSDITLYDTLWSGRSIS